MSMRGDMRGSMHELSKQFLRPSSPSGSQKSSRSKNSTRSKKSNKSNTSTRRSKNRKTRDRSNSSEDSEDFFTGESDEEFVSVSSNSDKAPRVSWTCEHCTYVNNPGVKVCAMCARIIDISTMFKRRG